MSFRTVRKPHMKKSVVIIANALLLVDRGDDDDAAVAGLFTLVMAIGRTWTSQEWVWKDLQFYHESDKKSFFCGSLEWRRAATCRRIKKRPAVSGWPVVGERDYWAVMLPKRPSASSFGPAVNKSV